MLLICASVKPYYEGAWKPRWLHWGCTTKQLSIFCSRRNAYSWSLKERSSTRTKNCNADSYGDFSIPWCYSYLGHRYVRVHHCTNIFTLISQKHKMTERLYSRVKNKTGILFGHRGTKRVLGPSFYGSRQTIFATRISYILPKGSTIKVSTLHYQRDSLSFFQRHC